jgi:hypothetical protein
LNFEKETIVILQSKQLQHIRVQSIGSFQQAPLTSIEYHPLFQPSQIYIFQEKRLSRLLAAQALN